MSEIKRPDRFRILIIGRANAGKTTILRAVCGAEGEPDVYDQEGKKITAEVRPERAVEVTLAEPEAVPHAAVAESEVVQDAIAAELSEDMPDATLAERSEQLTPRSARLVLRTTLRTTFRSVRAYIMCRAPDSVLAHDVSVGSNMAPSLHSRGTPSSILAPDSILAPNPPMGPNLAPLSHARRALNSILAPTALRGEHNIEYSLMFPSSPGFVFHDSCGFESGAADELELVRKFIQEKATLGSMENQLHAIWYCFSTDSNRFMTAADKEFFSTIDTGSVPVIAVFTKFDALDSVAFSALSMQGVPFKEAQKRAPEHAKAQFDQELLPLIDNLAHPPRAVVCLRNMHNTGSPHIIQKAASELIEKTEAALDDGALKVLLIQAQCIGVELCMKAAVNSGVITKAAQDALQEDLTTFNPLQKQLMKEIFKWFPSIWVGRKKKSRRRRKRRKKSRNASAADAFIKAMAPLITSSLDSMPPPLQILSVGCAAVIVAAKAFWVRPGNTMAQHITASSKHYIQSGAEEPARLAILEAFQDNPGPYDTPENRAALQQVVLSNYTSFMSKPIPDDVL
ncbi:hypothetical protein BOTBODRAFT_36790 [Botryobasidium botryosum FD-172 SS1]|uniref:G domain-containing protein n=1 Tax=Botryobasidium botryosum (strain FD-172 SS1) TaxID=930990 RepID=A0A067MDK7_BOTB1|nr:hypothetical protein BOTBODRAFT_36790 [Botryobasidium botryosum FD-172 SS1]